MKHSFEKILGALSRSRVRFLLAGGMAVNLHGVPRSTHDLDLYVDFRPANFLRALRTLHRMGFRPTIPESLEAIANARNRARWRREKGMIVVRLVDPDDPFHPVDIFVEHRVPFASAWRRRHILREGDFRVCLLSIPDLIILKRIAGREQDRADIVSLRKRAQESRERRPPPRIRRLRER